jgi:hypothetical protein
MQALSAAEPELDSAAVPVPESLVQDPSTRTTTRTTRTTLRERQVAVMAAVSTSTLNPD